MLQVAALLAGSKAVVQPGEELSQIEKKGLEGHYLLFVLLSVRILPYPDWFSGSRTLIVRLTPKGS